MMKTLDIGTPDPTNQLRMLEARATPGPWAWWTSNSFIGITCEADPANRRDGSVLQAFRRADGAADLSINNADMELIVALRNAAPALLRLVERGAEAERQLNARQAADHSTAIELAGKRAQVDRLTDELTVMRATRDSLRTDIAALGNIISDKQKQIDAKDAENKALKHVVDTAFGWYQRVADQGIRNIMTDPLINAVEAYSKGTLKAEHHD